MAYEELGEVIHVTLGGVDKKTGKKNPLFVEGFFVRVEQKPDKFHKDRPQNFYVFKTSRGEVGVYGKAGINRAMNRCQLGVMTKLTNTEETVDTGKGNPMIVFKVAQDYTKKIDVQTASPISSVKSTQFANDPDLQNSLNEDLNTYEMSEYDESEEDLVDDQPQIVIPPRSTRSAISAPPSAAAQAKVRAALDRGGRSNG